MTKENNPARPPKNYPRAYTPKVEPETKWRRRIRWTDIFLVLCITLMLMWPWIFFGAVWAQDGIQMNDDLAYFVLNNPHSTNFFVTFLGTVVRLAVGYLFSKAILRFGQERMTKHHLNLFHISLLSGFKNQKLPWQFGDLEYLWHSRRWLGVSLVVACWGTFIIVPSSTTGLLSPVQFSRTLYRQGTELNFSSSAADCIAWLNNAVSLLEVQPDQCTWETYSRQNYSTCLGGNQVVDILESGRGGMLSWITNNSDFLYFSQLGLQFSGPIRGVFPVSRLGYFPYRLSGGLPYNYTLMNQGLTSNINCEYAPQSPINVFGITGDTTNLLMQYNGTCDGVGETNVLPDNTQFVALNSTNTLTFWACKSPPNETDPSYFIYLSGLQNYATGIGNITCTISPIQPALFPVTYQSVYDIFSVGEPGEVDSTTFSGFLDQSVATFGNLVAEGQSLQSNLVAESVITYGVKYYGLPQTEQDPVYLQLYESMIQGTMEYLATYARLLYSIDPNPTSSCTRTVEAMFNYTVTGWSVKPEHIGFLIPLTLINLASLVIMIFVILGTTSGSYKSDPISAKSLILAEHHAQNFEPSGWKDCAVYDSRHDKLEENKEDSESQP